MHCLTTEIQWLYLVVATQYKWPHSTPKMSMAVEKEKAGEEMKGGVRKISGCFPRGVTHNDSAVAVALQVLILV